MVKKIASIFKSLKGSFLSDPEIRKIINNHPKLFGFIKKRLTKDEKYGLYLTIGFIITFVFFCLFYWILRDYYGQEGLTQADLRIITLVQSFRFPQLNNVMLFITYLGKGEIVIIGLVASSMLLLLRKNFTYIRTLIISVVFGETFVWLTKILVERPRPPLKYALYIENTYSFPSGHTFVALAFYGVLTYFLYKTAKNKFLKALVLLIGSLLILAISFSRIYLGVHWPSDVFASLAVGSGWLTTLITANEIQRKFKYRPQLIQSLSKKTINIFSFLIVFFWMVFIIWFYNFHPLQSIVSLKENPKVISSENLISTVFSDTNRYSETITGNPMEPINIIIVGTKDQLNRAFLQSDWSPSDPVNFVNLTKLAVATVFNQRYDSAPGTPSFWNTKTNEIGFVQHPTSVQERHHVHFWETSYITESGAQVFVGTAHYDKNIVFKSKIIPTHAIDPAVDKERNKIKADLVSSNLVNYTQTIQLVEPTIGQNQAGDKFFTDGKAYILFLKN